MVLLSFFYGQGKKITDSGVFGTVENNSAGKQNNLLRGTCYTAVLGIFLRCERTLLMS